MCPAQIRFTLPWSALRGLRTRILRALTNYECTQCFQNSALNIFFVFLLAAAVLVVIAVLVYVTISGEGRESAAEVVILKIAVNHFIIVSTFEVPAGMTGLC